MFSVIGITTYTYCSVLNFIKTLKNFILCHLVVDDTESFLSLLYNVNDPDRRPLYKCDPSPRNESEVGLAIYQ